MSWNKKFLETAFLVGSWSKDRSKKVGAVIVNDRTIIATGYNGFPIGIDDNIEERHLRPAKYQFTEHAERNAIYLAARNGVKTAGGKMYCSWYPCVECARAIIQSGIKELISEEPDFNDDRWGESFRLTREMFAEADVLVTFVKL